MKKRILCFLSILFVSLIMISCTSYPTKPRWNYYKEPGWNCDNETFMGEYKDKYYAKICELKQKYNMECYELVETEISGNYGTIICYLYCETYTFKFDIDNCNDYGYCDLVLYYYGEENEPIDYSDCKNLVDFLNEFTNYVAYDTIKEYNCYEKLYYQNIQNNTEYESEWIYFDNMVGNVKYVFEPKYKSAGYWYMLGKDSTVEKTCYKFMFEGITIPLE